MVDKMSRRGQVAVFVIIAVVIVAMIMALFFLNKRNISANTQAAENPQAAIQQCVSNAVNEVVDIMLPQGGFIEPNNYKSYNKIKIEYLCQNIGYFKPCINQHPVLITEIIKQIENYTKPRAEQCYQNIKKELEDNKYSVTLGDMELNVSLASNRVYVNIERKFILEKNAQTSRLEKIKVEVINPIYDLARVANEIANEEAKYCYFEYSGYMMLYPRFDIKKLATADTSDIYTIKDKNSNKEMNIAIRGCVIPPII